jgi:hypothetical protein
MLSVMSQGENPGIVKLQNWRARAVTLHVFNPDPICVPDPICAPGMRAVNAVNESIKQEGQLAITDETDDEKEHVRGPGFGFCYC